MNFGTGRFLSPISINLFVSLRTYQYPTELPTNTTAHGGKTNSSTTDRNITTGSTYPSTLIHAGTPTNGAPLQTSSISWSLALGVLFSALSFFTCALTFWPEGAARGADSISSSRPRRTNSPPLFIALF